MIEIAIVMIIIGLLAGGGISLISILTERKARNETIDYLKQAKEALISFTIANGRLPCADINGDGVEDPLNASHFLGSIPYQTLEIMPTDPYKRTLKYHIYSQMKEDRPSCCSLIDDGMSVGSPPAVVDADGTTTAFQVAAVIISSGPADADNDNDVFDAVSGAYSGDNSSGNPNYIRHPPLDNIFDDMAVYVTGNEIRQALDCGELVKETNEYLKQVKEAMISFAASNGRLPMPDTDGDGQENFCSAPDCVGTLPFVDLNVNPADSYTRPLKYEINSNLGTTALPVITRAVTCADLRNWNPLSGQRPKVVDADDPSATQISVVAIIISPGPTDTAGAGSIFEAITSGTHQGDNTDGDSRYIKHPPEGSFDDLVIYTGGPELYGGMECDEYDLCSDGIIMRNQSGVSYYYKQDGGGCSLTPWLHGTDRTILPVNSYEVFLDSTCGTPAPEPYINYTQQKNEDNDNNCKTEFKAGGGFGDDDGLW